MPRPDLTPPREAMAGPASRSRLASRFQQNRGQRTDDRPRRSVTPTSVPTRGSRCQKTRSETFCPLFSVLWHLHLVGLGRFERPTSRLSGVRSDQLSYRPKIRDQRTDDRAQTQRREPRCPCAGLFSDLCPLPLIWKGCVDGGPGRSRCRRPATEPRSQTAVCPLMLCPLSSALRKEVIQPQVPLRLPCYDFTPVADLTVDGCLPDPKIQG